MSGSGRRLTVLGCDGSYPGPRGAASGYLVRGGGATVLLDAGPGTFANLQALGDPGALDAVVLSHEHPDHWTDVESLCVWLRQVGRRDRPLPVHAPPGLRARSYFARDPALDWQVAEPSMVLVVRELRLRFGAADHGPPTLAVALEETGGGPALGYSADTGPDWSPAELGPVGTLLCEATYTRVDEGRLRHLSGRQAGALAAEAGVDRLVLTHRWPTVSARALADEAGAAFGRPVDQAAVGREFDW
jgi:ribonuclease BN (tRNA processing enzyme)